MSQGIILAAPQIVEPARSGTAEFVNLIISNATIARLLIVAGGLIIGICVGLLIWRRVAPTSTIGQALSAQGNHTAMWCVMFITLGVILILPAQILPFVVQLLASVVQVAFDIAGAIFGF
ncbi:hypothetical protein [uncultured Bifidobacterium sp.]|uniref:hypothetical protein n=1 Tax=uncultured Bifidobacterium sp. TaxID=165187 RepID=UPI0027DBF361|nr:hypothetical protein [uncultured Bifidobacterium sp.]